MHRTNKFLAVALSLVVLLASACTKANSEDQNQTGATTAIPLQKINDCHDSANPYPSQITNNIVGNWLWQKSYAPMTQLTTTASSHVIVHFNDAGTFNIIENSTTVATGTWNLKKFSDSRWEIELSQTHAHVKGNISLCGDELLLSTAYVDGAINYFVRK